MVGAVGLLHDLEAQVAGAGAAGLAQRLDGGEAVLLARRNDVDVRHHHHGVAGGAGAERAERDTEVHALVERRIADGLDPLAHLRGARRLAVRLEGFLVLPRFQDHELVRLAETARQLAAQVTLLAARRVATAAQRSHAQFDGSRFFCSRC